MVFIFLVIAQTLSNDAKEKNIKFVVTIHNYFEICDTYFIRVFEAFTLWKYQKNGTFITDF